MSIDNSALAHLRKLIDGEVYREGDKLPPERQLSEELKVSRRALRNAFSILEAEGKVWRGVGKGTFVLQQPKNETLGTATAQASNPAMVLEAKISLEPIVARYAAQRVTSIKLEEMRECVEKSARAPDLATYDVLDERFHRLIAEASQNPVLQALYDVLSNVWKGINWGSLREGYFTPEWQRIYTRQHRVIIEAISNRDLDRAENLMLEHWQSIRVNIIKDAFYNGAVGRESTAASSVK